MAMSKKSTDNFCCQYQPLLNIELDHVVPDEIHLLLRVTDILTENLIQECLDLDKEDELDRCRGAERGIHLKKQLGLVVFLLTFGRREMQMESQVASTIGQFCWVPTRNVFWLSYRQNW
jgi:hypothetical protein